MSVGYIQPDSTIKLLSGVPLDSSYEHTLYFTNGAAQYNYFSSKAIPYGTFTRQSYQRSRRGYIRVEAKAEDLYSVNYLMFQNTAFGDKWFYAFVDGVDYVNNNVTELHYTIDAVQSWYFKHPTQTSDKCYTLKECFIERQHATSDLLFENLVSEPFGNSEYVSMTGHNHFYPLFYTPSGESTQFNVCILASRNRLDPEASSQFGRYQIINNVLTPLFIIDHLTLPTQLTALQNVFNAYDGYEDEIIAVFQYPSDWYDQTDHGIYEHSFPTNLNVSAVMNGFSPKNMKLYTSPYTVLRVSNNSGNSVIYNIQDFPKPSGLDPTVLPAEFVIYGVYVTSPMCVCFPTTYRNNSSSIQNIDYGLTISNFPMCAWVGDVWAAWWAQNRAGVTTAILADSLKDVRVSSGEYFDFTLDDNNLEETGFGKGVSPFQAGGSTVPLLPGNVPLSSPPISVPWSMVEFNPRRTLHNISRLLATRADMRNYPPTIHGMAQGDTLAMGMDAIGYVFDQMCYRPDELKRIDEFFNRYGYAQHNVGVPNIHARSRYTYVKTVGCTVIGEAPNEDLRLIERIFDNGITWWSDIQNVGVYPKYDSTTYDNDILT